MGYKTRVSREGSDLGIDILASPDGFGFESPRIIVEVKHRSGTIGSKEIRNLVGGRHASDKGLFVSTGGFTKDARYEADRANIPLMLWDLDDLVQALVENYENADQETRTLLPLTRLFWPV
jgi:restriction system protein